jgi:hypothetical protein
LYIGVGYTIKNTVFRKACAWANDWVYALTGAAPAVAVGASAFLAGFNDGVGGLGVRTLTAATSSHNLLTRPVTATMAKCKGLYSNSVAGAVAVGQDDGANVHAAAAFYADGAVGPTQLIVAAQEFMLQVAAGSNFSCSADAAFATALLIVVASGYNMNAPRCSP